MIAEETPVTRALFRAIAVSLGLDPASSYANACILRSYADPPPPELDRHTFLCFFDLSPDASAPLYTEHTVQEGVHAVYLYIPYLLNLVFYGRTAESGALLVRSHFFLDGIGKPRAILRDAGIYPVPPAGPPSIVYEEQDSLFRKRADLVIPLRLLDNSDDSPAPGPDADPIESPPDIIPHVR